MGSVRPPLQSLRKAPHVHDAASVLADHVCPPPRQLGDELCDLSEGVAVPDLAVQLPGDCTSVVANLKNDLGRSVRKRDRTKVLGLLRGQDKAQAELPPLP